jgi:anaerobic magnesium-protoporphyrin IX monomethyl ester cyclase
LVRVVLVKPAPPFVVQEHDRPEYPCLGLAYLSAVLKAIGVEVLVIDASFDGIPLDEMNASIVRFNPHILGFTAMTHEIAHVASVALRLRESLPHSLIVVGGPHATVAPARTLEEFPVFDLAVVGEGEDTFKQIVKELEMEFDNRNLDEAVGVATISADRLCLVQGIAWRSGINVRINQRRSFIQDLASLPFPDYDHLARKIDTYPIFSSRGCPNNCIFCCRIMGNKIRVRTPKSVVDEIKYALGKFGPNLFDFVDETFTFPKTRTMAICDLIITEGINKRIKWKAQSRVTLVDQELFDKMKEAGCIDVDIGVESGNSEMLNAIKKGITLDDALKAVKAAKKAGLKTGSYFIIGHPFETKKTINDTIQFASKLNTSSVSFGIMVPYPGTEVYEMAIRGEGGYHIISGRWEDYDKQLGNALEIDGLSREQLEKWQRKAYLTFYFKNFRLLGVIQLVISQRKLLWRMLTK